MTRPGINHLAFDALAFASFPATLAVFSFLLAAVHQVELGSILAVASIATTGQSFFLVTFFDLPIGSTRPRGDLLPPEGAF